MSVKKGFLDQQTELMETTLDQNFFQREGVLFCVHVKLVRGFGGEKLKGIQEALVGPYSLDIQGGGPLYRRAWQSQLRSKTMKWTGAPTPTPTASGDYQWGQGSDTLNLDAEFDMLQAARVRSALQFFSTASS